MSETTRGRLQATLVLMVLGGFVTSAVAGSQPGSPVGSAGGTMEFELIRWAVTQGGLTIALLAVLWDYRRHLTRHAAEEGERVTQEVGRIAILVDLVKASTAANEKSAAASEATEKAVHRLARAIETMEKRIAG